MSFELLWKTLLSTVLDVLPIVAVLFLFQTLVVRRPIPRLRRVSVGLIYVVIGLALSANKVAAKPSRSGESSLNSELHVTSTVTRQWRPKGA